MLFDVTILFQVLVTTKNLAWTSDLRARLVIVKGTEQYDVRSQRYVDMPLSGWLKKKRFRLIHHCLLQFSYMHVHTHTHTHTCRLQLRTHNE